MTPETLLTGVQRILALPNLTEKNRTKIEAELPKLEMWADGAPQSPAEKADATDLFDRLRKAGLWDAAAAQPEPQPPAPAPEVASGPQPPAKAKASPKSPKPAKARSDALKPDLKQAAAFIEALTGKSSTAVTFQTFDDGPKPGREGLVRVLHGTLDRHAATLTSLNDRGAGIFITVNQTDGHGRKIANIKAIRCLYADFDGAEAVARALAATRRLQPSIVVESSPGKRHLYWLTDGITVEAAGPLNKALGAAVGADPGAYDTARVLRLPGFIHRKGEPTMCRLIETDPTARYTAQQATEAFALPVGATAPAQARNDAADGLGSVINDADEALLRDALKHIDASARATWIEVCGALAGSGETGFRLFTEWAATAKEGYKGEADCREKFDELAKAPKSGYPAIFTKAQGLGWSMSRVAGAAGEVKGGTSFIAWANTVDMVKVEWLWRHRLARGMLHLLGGTPGTGKSTIAFALAAAISCGGTFPDGTAAPKGKVLIWSGEDSYNATIKPRLTAAGADMGNIGFLSQPRETTEGKNVDFNPAEHLPQLMREIEAMPRGTVAMLLIDPIVTMVGKGDNNSTSEVRSALTPLVSMLDDLSIVGLGIMHFTKGSENKDPKDRFSGSGGYIALARVGIAVVKDQNEPGRHLLTVAKSNIGPEGGGHNYHIEQVEVTDPKVGSIETSRIVWGEQLEGDARDLIREAETVQRDRPAVKVDQAKALLRELLGSGQPVLVGEIEVEADGAGIGWRTMNTAKTALGVVSERSDPADNRSPYQWVLPMTDFDAIYN